MKKIILLVRVSSNKQDYEDQTNELISYAQKDGYTLDDMEIIQDKESATKLSDEERLGLNKMYAAINDPDNRIECVYCWELSRISRKPVTLYVIHRELLNPREREKIKKETGRINLKIKNPNISLLNDRGEPDDGAEIVFGLYVTLCKSEISTRTDRTRRTKVANALRGKYNGGGKIMFGYAVDENGYFIKETERGEADAVLKIFELYSTGKFGEYKLYRELVARGIELNRGNIMKILQAEEYTGEVIPARTITAHKGNKDKETKMLLFTRQYPAIITRDLFEKCREVRRTNATNLDRSQNIYYAAKLCKCSSCGYTMAVNKNNAVFRCENKYKIATRKKCVCNDTINVNAVDSVAWHVARKMEIDFIFNFNQEQLTEWREQIAILQLKIDNCHKIYQATISEQIKKLQKEFPDFPQKEIESLASQSKTVKHVKKESEDEKTANQTEIDRLKRLSKESEIRYKTLSAVRSKEAIKKEIDDMDDKGRYDIVHKHIKEIKIAQYPQKKGTKRITVKFFDKKKEDEIFYYNGKVKDKSQRLYRIVKTDFYKKTGEGRDLIEVDKKFRGVVEQIEYLDFAIRFERKKKCA